MEFHSGFQFDGAGEEIACGDGYGAASGEADPVDRFLYRRGVVFDETLSCACLCDADAAVACKCRQGKKNKNG